MKHAETERQDAGWKSVPAIIASVLSAAAVLLLSFEVAVSHLVFPLPLWGHFILIGVPILAACLFCLLQHVFWKRRLLPAGLLKVYELVFVIVFLCSLAAFILLFLHAFPPVVMDAPRDRFARRLQYPFWVGGSFLIVLIAAVDLHRLRSRN